MKKKLIAATLCCVMSLSTVACGGNAASNTQSSSSSTVNSDAKYTVGICQLVQHEALDAATQGFQDALTEKLGDDVTFDYQNAQGDSATCSTIVTGFVSNNYDLIMANATPALQAAVSATDSIPILGTSITDYATALSMEGWGGTSGINVSGTSDLAPLDQQEDMILELCPDVKQVAILYCSAEANSSYQAKQIEGYLDEDKVAYKEYTFSDSNDMQAVVTSAASECDVFYIPTDNTAASNMTIVTNVCQPAGIPVICGEENMTASGGLATLSISYYDLGYATGEMAADILVNGKDPATMEIQYASATTKKYNAAYAEAIGMTMPSDYEAIEVEE
ncbi:MAG: ABC transporter substrate-binding protein [Lachnospiraceae bacterium]|nr:ABC transporter substrate-binding protein [Lachnospiraceae bacterium]